METIWVVDDDTYILKIFKFILEKNGIPYRCFESAEALLATVWDSSVGFVLTDIRLPGKKGDELCRILRKNHPHIQFIALTTQVTPVEKEAFSAIGFDSVLLKPFTETELLALIAKENNGLSFPLLDALIEDETDRAEILQQFREETQRDLGTLQQSVQEENAETTLLLVHRLAGRLAQFSQEVLSERFRKLELALSVKSLLPEHKTELIALQQTTRDFLEKIPGLA